LRKAASSNANSRESALVSGSPMPTATCPVVVVRDETAAPHRQVAVGIGDPDTSADSLEFAFEEAALRKAALLAVHAWNIPRSGTERAFASPGARWSRSSRTG
jgi:hypothetical protein